MKNKYKAYNRLYFSGKPTGKRFVSETGTTEEEARRKATKQNRVWNNLKTNQRQGYAVKLVAVKKIGQATRRKKRNINPFGIKW